MTLLAYAMENNPALFWCFVAILIEPAAVTIIMAIVEKIIKKIKKDA